MVHSLGQSLRLPATSGSPREPTAGAGAAGDAGRAFLDPVTCSQCGQDAVIRVGRKVCDSDVF